MSAGRPTPTWLDARNLLVVRLDNAGDIVMLGPALRAVKATSPTARITLLASPAGSRAAELLPWIDEVLTWRAVWQDLGHLPFDPARERELIAELAARGFDAALIFTSFSQTPHVPGYVCYLAGIALRAGASHEFGGASLSHEFRGLPDSLHQVDRNLHLVSHLGFEPADQRLEIAIPPASHEVVAQRLRALGIDAGARLAVLHPGASASARRYPADRYGKVAAALLAEGWQVVLTGSERERDQLDAASAAAAAALAGVTERPFAAASAAAGAARTASAGDPGAAGVALPQITDLSMPEFAALIARSAVVVCGNTLPLHLADAVGTAVVTLYSGTDLVSQWQPRFTPARILQQPVPCAPCYRFACPIGLPCLDIAPDEVVAAIESVTTQPAIASVAAQPSITREPLP